MAEYAIEIRAARRRRSAISHREEDGVRIVARAPSRAAAEALARVEKARLEKEWDRGGDYYWDVQTRIAPAPEARPRRRRKPLRVPAVRDRTGRWHDRKGRFLSPKEAVRRNRISASMKRVWKKRRERAEEARKARLLEAIEDVIDYEEAFLLAG
jgi:hypothetical protein